MKPNWATELRITRTDLIDCRRSSVYLLVYLYMSPCFIKRETFFCLRPCVYCFWYERDPVIKATDVKALLSRVFVLFGL